jgi:hypothetical protein
MIPLDDLVHAIQVAVHAASDAVMSKNLDLIDQFFVEADEAQDTAAAATKADSDGESDAQAAAAAAREAARAVTEAVAALRAHAAGDQSANDKTVHAEDGGKQPVLKPRMVLMQFPNESAQGPAIHTVYVPLISLVPMPQHQISELKFTTELDLSIVNEKLMVSFPSGGTPEAAVGNGGSDGKTKGNSGEPGQGTSRVEVTITNTPTPKGIAQVVEGYNRSLRAQIPN